VTPTPVPPTQTSTQSAAQDFITIRTADTDEPIVALTFDAGADRGYAEEILDTLQAEDVVATFGMTAHWAEANPDLIIRMVNEGHTLMNHTETHRSWTGFSTSSAPLTSAERAEELRVTEAVIETIVGYDMRPYFRPPYGDYDDSVIADLQANGYTVNVMWTVDSLGWNGLTAAEITTRTLNGTVPGAIHLFHVGAASQDAAALPAIISGLRDLGYRFVTIQDMVGR
jgi:peptidoglycan/xylan/chitin deacetylase (PgdA/CDA1 family)